MTEDKPDVSWERLYSLMEDYASARSRREQRRIENSVLEETVWKVEENEYRLTESELHTLLERVNNDDEVVQRILRRLYLDQI